MATPAEHLQEALGHYRAGRLPLAEHGCRQVLEIDPRNTDALNLLGILAQAAGHAERALDLFGRASAIEPSRAAFHRNLAEVYRALGRESEAGTCLGRALWLEPDAAPAHNAMGIWLLAQGAFAEAEECFRQALRLSPEDAGYRHHLDAALLRRVNDEPPAAPGPRPASALGPELRLRLALLLPVIYASTDDLERSRARLEAKLAGLRNEDLLFRDQDPLSHAPQSYLAYQGRNDRTVQETLAGIYIKSAPWLQFVAPHCLPAAQPDAAGPARPIRIGFLSLFFLNHTIGKLNVGMIGNLSRAGFRVILLRLPGPNDDMARLIQQSADEVVNLPGDLAGARSAIAGQKLDVLLYTDIGIDPFTYLLAFARLAPVQCVTWGHPVTTGIPTIDYFLSSKHLELPDAEAHYSEALVRLLHLNTHYREPRLTTPLLPRAAFGLPEDAHLYVCTQSLFKCHPEFDPILGRILRADPQGRLVLIECAYPGWTRLLSDRLRQADPDVAGRIVVLPRLRMDAFLHLQALADVLLDTIHFGGGNTSLEALAFGTPIVTLPGRFLRSRITYACYEQMGILDCVAADPDDYVRIALRLGTDPACAASVRARILDRKHLLYASAQAVRELEEFLLSAVQRARAHRSAN